MRPGRGRRQREAQKHWFKFMDRHNQQVQKKKETGYKPATENESCNSTQLYQDGARFGKQWPGMMQPLT